MLFAAKIFHCGWVGKDTIRVGQVRFVDNSKLKSLGYKDDRGVEQVVNMRRMCRGPVLLTQYIPFFVHLSVLEKVLPDLHVHRADFDGFGKLALVKQPEFCDRLFDARWLREVFGFVHAIFKAWEAVWSLWGVHDEESVAEGGTMLQAMGTIGTG